MRESSNHPTANRFGTPGLLAVLLICAVVGLLGSTPLPASELPKDPPAEPVQGFYLHACWDYGHPFAIRKWTREDYEAMFRLLRRMGYNTVMLWPVTEALPAPLSASDAAELRRFRSIIDDAQKAGLHCWLARTANLLCRPEIATKPWMERNFMPNAVTVRLDDDAAKKAYLQHRETITAILNNADGYVTIDGDPGGYAGARAEHWLEVLVADRAALARHGVAPQRQLVIPWLWCGWGTKGVWVEPVRPYLDTELDVLLSGWNRLAPALLMPGRSIGEGHGNGRETFKSMESRRATDRSVLLCYEAVEFEPTPPAPVLQFDDIRRIVTQDEAENGRHARGWFANAQQPIMVLPNIYYFARCTADPGYANLPRERVLADLAEAMGGPKEALTVAWSCLERNLDHLPADIPATLRKQRLDGPAAADLPGGEAKYREILATAVECRRAALTASSNGKDVEVVAAALESLGRWWAMNRYALSETAGNRLELSWIHVGFWGSLHSACRANKAALAPHRPRLADALSKAAAIAPASADACVGQLLGP